jgi:hypothetical protein
MFFTNDIKRDYERAKGRGAEFTMPPTDVTCSTIAMLKDNLWQPGSAHPAGTLVGRPFRAPA